MFCGSRVLSLHQLLRIVDTVRRSSLLLIGVPFYHYVSWECLYFSRFIELDDSHMKYNDFISSSFDLPFES